MSIRIIGKVVLGFSVALFALMPGANDFTARAQESGVNLAGTYEGKVARRFVKGGERETRLFRVTMNPDLNTGKVLVYELEGKLRNELAFVVKRASGTTFTGETVPINATPGYRPDRIKLMFARDGSWLNWSHTDGATEGSGTLRK